MKRIPSKKYLRPTQLKKPLCYSLVFFALALACLCGGLVVNGYAANYYVSNSGSDSNNGTSTSSPWQTIAHINAQTFSPGDSILFKRGGIWREQLNVSSSGSSGNPITFGAYGNGVAPTITGANNVTGFSLVSSNLWRKTGVTVQPKIFTLNGTLGTLRASQAALASEGDWYWESHTLWVYATTDPSGNVEIGQRNYCILVEGRYLTKENLTLKMSNTAFGGGNWPTGGNDFCTIQNCTITKNNDRGIFIENSKNCVVDGCEASYNIDGIFFYLATSTPGESANHEVKRCYCHDNVKNGILFYSDTGTTMRQTKVSIHDNECSNNSCGIYVHFLDNSSIYGNHTHHNTKTIGETYGIAVASCFNCEFYLNEINDNGGAALLYYGDDKVKYGPCNGNKFYRNNFYNNSGIEAFGAAAPVANTANNNEVYYNIFHNNNTQYTMVFDNSNSGCKLYNNTVYGCSGTSMLFGSSNPGWEIHNNIFALNQGYAIYAGGGGSPNLSHSNNCYYKASGKLVYFGGAAYNSLNIQTFEAAAVKTDPLMVNPASGDFQLQPDSPCINAGVNVGLTQDYTGRSIVGLPDIGAYEYYSR